MSYLVLARKYRPQTFEQVVGQAHVTQTLTNAIQGGRVAHAILFSGPRGTGKTTIARILAKAMNCEHGPTPTPCNTCRFCMDITAGRSVDVFEIDGASNNSVDQVRELRDNSRYMPAHSRYKIYIIDEVHMLSIAAFNALLKTLEEPPAHVMFLFATTEVHKIPITILSRCQRHDLRRIALPEIVQQMEDLCRQESATLSTDNLWSIARESGGSMRDALSLLDQILACSSQGQLDDNDVMNLLGSMDRRTLFDLSEAVFARDITRILDLIDTVFRTGQDLKRFYADLLMHFRHLMLIKMEARPETLADLSPGDIDTLTQQVDGVSIAFIDQIFTLLFNAETSVRQASQPRLAIEMVFFKIHQITPTLPIDLLIERMDSLLKNPSLQASPSSGIIETQSTYGQPSGSSPMNPHSISPTEAPVMTAHHAAQHPNDAPDRGRADSSADANDDAWSRFLVRMGQAKPSIGAALARAQLVSVSSDKFVVSMRDNDYTMNLVRKNFNLVENVCRQHADRGIHIDFVGDGNDDVQAAVTAKQKANELRQQMLNHPLVADAVDIFGGKIEDIKIK